MKVHFEILHSNLNHSSRSFLRTPCMDFSGIQRFFYSNIYLVGLSAVRHDGAALFGFKKIGTLRNRSTNYFKCSFKINVKIFFENYSQKSCNSYLCISSARPCSRNFSKNCSWYIFWDSALIFLQFRKMYRCLREIVSSRNYMREFI